MIQLVEARFSNFRLLREVELKFARDAESPVTVIRAENATGKTTVLTALTWALFGDEGIPGRRSSFRLHPIDWIPERDGATCKTTAEVRFVTVDDESGLETTYDLIRTETEEVSADGGFTVEGKELIIFRKDRSGDEPISNATAFLNNRVLPLTLKDVFFIDGDRALAFIETTDERSAKRDRVERAVRQLLGLDLLESAKRHVDQARREAVQAVRKEAQGTSLERLTNEENDITGEVERLEEEKASLEEERLATEGRKRKADEALRDALASGGAERKTLEQQLTSTEGRLGEERRHYSDLVAQQRRLINSPSLAIAVALPSIVKTSELLAALENRKVIPNTLPEVVQDRLARGTCICGRDVSPGSEGHTTLCELLEDTRQLGENQEILMHLSNVARRVVIDAESGDRRWAEDAVASQTDIAHSRKLQDEDEKRVAELRARVSAIPDRDIAELEKLRSGEDRELTRLTGEIARKTERIASRSEERAKINRQRLDAQKKEGRYLKRLAEETAAKDLLSVIAGTIEELSGETLREVSDQMNEIFLNMIVADPEQGSGVIQRAQLTESYDIVVDGPEGRSLDPDRDLSGAQRRALTLSFILALVKVSGVKAPNVVDTPLGMTSGPVRRAVLQYAAIHSSQLVLLLTSSEIAGTEDILDKYMGRVYTLTNTDHYPERLKNDPGTDRIETLVCECDYYSSCHICERKDAM
jgi:DNA sulfur modification protein DndD